MLRPAHRSLPRCLASLCAIVLPSACLITEVPEFPPPERTPPFLLASTATPLLNATHLVRSDDEVFEVTAEVQSEDVVDSEDPDQGIVFYKLLIDYGRASGPFPYQDFVSNGQIAAGTFSEKGRKVTARWLRDSTLVGCHTFTLMVSHKFRGNEPAACPEKMADSSQLTWRVYICDPTEQCPPPDAACPVDDVLPDLCLCTDEATPEMPCGMPT